MNEHPTVHEAWAAVLEGLPAIGKARRNQQQGFAFRGVDDVLDHLNPLLGKHGCHIIPVGQEALREDRPTAKGGVMHTVYLTADWRIYGPAGDSFDAQTLGEGTDSGDKATSKAQTMAFKYLLWPSLAVAENELDPDGITPEATVAQPKERTVRQPPGTPPADPDTGEVLGTEPVVAGDIDTLVAEMSTGELTEALKSRDLAVGGKPDERRERLVDAMQGEVV